MFKSKYVAKGTALGTALGDDGSGGMGIEEVVGVGRGLIVGGEGKKEDEEMMTTMNVTNSSSSSSTTKSGGGGVLKSKYVGKGTALGDEEVTTMNVSSEGGGYLKIAGGGGEKKKKTLEESLYPTFITIMEEEIYGAISVVCKEMNVTQIDKETGEEKHTSFCLDYLYKKMIKEQLSEGIRDFLHDKMGNKRAKATLKDISSATIFNYKMELCFKQEDMEQLLFWCRSEQQLKFWKKMWYSWMFKANNNLKGKGYKGSLRYPVGFYKTADKMYGITHEVGYIPPNKRDEGEDHHQMEE